MICLPSERCAVVYSPSLRRKPTFISQQSNADKIKKMLIGACVALVSTHATAAIDSAITIDNEWAIGTESKQSQKFETTIKPEVEIDLGRDAQLTVIGRIRYDAEDHIDVDDDTDAELREFYVETTIGRSFLTLGKQQVVWGKADGLKVLDVVNPQEWREFILDDFNESRIPLWTVNAEIPINDFTLQLLWIPDQTYHKFAQQGDLYRLTSPQLVPQVPAGVDVVFAVEERPNDTLQDADWGMQLSTFWNGWDLTLNYLYHFDDRPVLYRQLSLTPNGPVATITPRYERSHLIGTTFSNAFGNFTLRGEVGYSRDRYISTNSISDNDGVVKTNELAYVIGLDWFGFSNTLLSTQLFQSRLSNNDAGMLRDDRETTVTFLSRHDFINETLTTELLWIHNTDLDDGVVHPKISYQLDDEITIGIGADIFYGDKTGLF
ncbi:MAG: hypothetical protein L3J04_07000, partial [Robiginitomaculum sp.]|nr:hypothetical protein [Robiginitomaculum sp.]